MKKYIILFSVFTLVALTWVGCTKYPVDEDGLLITTRGECYVVSLRKLPIFR